MNAVVQDIQPARRPLPVVHKFGGTSLADAAAVRQAAAIVSDETATPCYVVVSAAGGVTNDLLDCVRTAAAGGDWARLLERVRRRQCRLVAELAGEDAAALRAALNADCRHIKTLLMAAATLRAGSPETEDAVAAHGEIWSMRLFAAVLRQRGLDAAALDARDFLRARRSGERVDIDWAASQPLFAAAASACTASIVVAPGFVAACADRGITLTLGRNGSDWSATIVARLAGARAVTIWSDVPGVLDADPATVADASAQVRLSFDAAHMLAVHGARVLHPATLAPLEGTDAEVRVRCTFDPNAEGTTIDRHAQLPSAIVTAAGDTVTAIGAGVQPAQMLAMLANAHMPVLDGEMLPGRVSLRLPPGSVERAQRVLHRRWCRRRRQVDVVLIGAGKVGSAFLRALADREPADIRLLGIANSTAARFAADGITPRHAHRTLHGAPACRDAALFGEFLLSHCEAAPVIVDATGSTDIAARHGRWLQQGIHVVTANKRAAAAGWITPEHREHAFYGDTATVGAGLPVLVAIRRLRRAGDTIERIEGILSGSLAYLFHALERGRSFSAALAAAEHAGYTEPDPRADLAGKDVARKLAIIVAAAGIDTTIPTPRPLLATGDLQTALPALDAELKFRAHEARAQKCVLRYLATASADGTNTVGLAAVPRNTALAQTRGAENVVVIHSHAYAKEPLVIRGPGAGPLVTARALLGDIGAILERFG